MKDIFTAPFVVEMAKITANMYRLGWDERNSGNLRRQSELALHGLRLVLAEESLGAASDRAQAVAFARLEQNGNDEDQRSHNEQHGDNTVKDSHNLLPP